MEYCELGNIQKELDSGKQYEEPVFFIFIFDFLLGVKEMFKPDGEDDGCGVMRYCLFGVI
jgi:hypothetical protein